MKARKETPTRGAPAVCFHAIVQKVLISENHKAQTLSAEADSYVKNTLFYVTRSNSKPPVKKVIGLTQLLHYNDTKPFYNPKVIKKSSSSS